MVGQVSIDTDIEQVNGFTNITSIGKYYGYPWFYFLGEIKKMLL